MSNYGKHSLNWSGVGSINIVSLEEELLKTEKELYIIKEKNKYLEEKIKYLEEKNKSLEEKNDNLLNTIISISKKEILKKQETIIS